MKQVTVRSGKGDKDRFTTLSALLVPLLENHLLKVKVLHDQVLAGALTSARFNNCSGTLTWLPP